MCCVRFLIHGRRKFHCCWIMIFELRIFLVIYVLVNIREKYFFRTSRNREGLFLFSFFFFFELKLSAFSITTRKNWCFPRWLIAQLQDILWLLLMKFSVTLIFFWDGKGRRSKSKIRILRQNLQFYRSQKISFLLFKKKSFYYVQYSYHFIFLLVDRNEISKLKSFVLIL